MNYFIDQWTDPEPGQATQELEDVVVNINTQANLNLNHKCCDNCPNNTKDKKF